MDDFLALIDQPYKEETMLTMCDLPHPTIQKFGAINIAIVGASRRFLAQITRHQNEVKFMSGSLQYSDYSDDAQFCVPYEILEAEHYAQPVKGDKGPLYDYIHQCRESMIAYASIAKQAGNDAAGFAAPQGLRNVLLISATPYQWKHMIQQRGCNRNTLETQYVMLRCWEELAGYSDMFKDCWPACKRGMIICPEGKMSCGSVPGYKNVSTFLNYRFPLLRGTE